MRYTPSTTRIAVIVTLSILVVTIVMVGLTYLINSLVISGS
tara:strand:+ start:967 stop:1089 length:123 start_codon:yes stop_codon:yes gene_type:complete